MSFSPAVKVVTIVCPVDVFASLSAASVVASCGLNEYPFGRTNST
jgi:diphthamide biosynthesis methyltransferase